MKCRPIAEAFMIVGFCLLTLCAGLSSPQAQAQGLVCLPGGSPNGPVAVPGQLIQLIGCTEERQQGNNQSATITPPTGNGAAIGDLLLYFLNTDGGNESLNAPGNIPTGWTLLDYNGDLDISSAVYFKIADAGDLAPATSYTFNWGSNEQFYSYLLRFSDASGVVTLGSTSTGTSTAASAPDVTIDLARALAIRAFTVDQRDINEDSSLGLTTAETYDITQNTSRKASEGGGGGATVSGSAAYGYPVTASTGVATLSLTGNEEWHGRTLVVDPIEFRLSLTDGAASVCGTELVTLSVTNRNGIPMTWFTGTVTLTASNATGATWSDGGALTNAVSDLGNGTATYQFATGDAGTATFEFFNPNVGITNFDVEYDGISNLESSGFDPDLIISPDCPPLISTPSCVAGTSTTVAIGQRSAVVSQQGRMVLMAINFEGTGSVSSATFDPSGVDAPMTRIFFEANVNGLGNRTELWGILDADLPTGPGTYTAEFVTDDDAPSMCLFFVDDTEQAFPQADIGTPSNGAVNGSQAQNQQDAITSITTTVANSLVLSLVGNGSGGADYSAVAPSPPMSRLFDAPDPGGGAEFEGSSGIVATPGLFTVTETWGGGNPNRHSHVVASFPPLPVVPTEIRIAHDGESDVCSIQSITISVTNSVGTPATNFTGTITISNSALAGTWVVNDATNALVDNGNGEVEYTFDIADDGEIILDFQLSSANAAVDFDVTSTTPGIASPSGANDPTLEVVNCTAQIDVLDPGNTLNVCNASTTIRLTILDRDNGVPTGTIGTIALETDTDNGDFISTTGAGDLQNGTPDNGLATYEFDAGDGNQIDFEFSSETPESLSFEASAAYYDFDAAGSDEDLDVLACEFRISHSGTSDVCSPLTVTIAVFNSANAQVTDYVGTVNLSTSSFNGTWSDGDGVNSVVDPVDEDGSATYEFAVGDGGDVELTFTNRSVETTNINVSDGTTTDSNASFDPNLTVANCTFRITMDDETMDACSFELITITVYDRNDVIANDFNGTITLSVNAIQGNWADAGGLNGTLTDTIADDGEATYTFVDDGDGINDDDGVAVFAFTNRNSGSVNIDVVSETIEEDGAFDPNLAITGCLPSIVTSACYDGNGGGPGLGDLTIGGPDPGRMVVMIVWYIDGTQRTINTPTFGGVNMTQIENVHGGDTGIEMWGILDADLPGAGSYAGDYSFASGPNNDPSMCLVELANVEQSFPQSNTTTPTLGQVNSNTFVADGGTLDLDTTITTQANNALILSAALSDRDVTGNTWFNDVEPDPPMSLLFSGTNDQNPEAGTAGGSSGVQPTTGLFTVTDIDTQDADSSAAHIVASFNPVVRGGPIVEGYVPVVLFDTLSGNLSFQAIGRSLRSGSNDDGDTCNFQPLGTGSSATLSLPDTLGVDTEVLVAYLYWAGSGSPTDADDTVEFGPTGSIISITADDVFLIENAIGAGTDFFAAYKDVTAQITANNVDYTLRQLDVRDDGVWDLNTICAGGWSLIVVYSNPKERFRVANLFHGFQPFQNSSFTLVPRNFRMSTADGAYLPNGQVAHVTIEGDDSIASNDESLGLQTNPGDSTFNILENSFNPQSAEYNNTVTRPIFTDTFGTGFYEFDATAGLNGDGYEIDFPGVNADEDTRSGPGFVAPGYDIGQSWGFDIDTHFVEGPNPGDLLYNFAQPGAEAEKITTQYGSGQDLVMLISEVITITNFDLADLEIFKAATSTFKVNDTGEYTITVTNNGNGGLSDGEATGELLVGDILPSGLTINTVTGTGWDCSLATSNAFTCAIDIANDCGAAEGCVANAGELAPGESLAPIIVDVAVGGTSFFPNEINNRKNVARLQHNGGGCTVTLVAGVIPDPDDCNRSPQFDNVNDLQGGAVDINDIDDKTPENNNVDSVITQVRGIVTDLSIEKELNGILEVGGTGSYTLTISNLGPDDTTGGAGGTITVNDLTPAGVTFDFVGGTGWNCPGDQFPCTYSGVLPFGASTTIDIDVTVTGSTGQNVTNTAQVVSGTFNFDSESDNDSDTLVATIIAPPVSSQEKFLLSVSAAGNTEIGGLPPFVNDDLIVYDPLADEGTEYFDNDDVEGDSYSVDDADAVHLFQNGKVALSAAGPGTSTIGSNDIDFQPEDIVIWDPVLKTADPVLLFDGSMIFDGPIGTDENIDAVYVREDGVILFSTEGPASITFGSGPPTTVSFERGDIVAYDPSDGSATIVFDASDSNLFDTQNVQVDAIYQRVDDNDSDLNKDVYILSIEGADATVGACAGCDPVGGTTLSQDDIVQVDLTGPFPVTENLFLGDQANGVFSPTDTSRTIDALHVLEDRYIGYFGITQSQAGNTCTAGEITIRKYKGLTFNLDTDYEGSILITTDIGQGDWAIASGNGLLDNGTADDGTAIYTFDSSDGGQVTLFLTQDTVGTLNVNVTNSVAEEIDTQDPNFVFNNVITTVTYRDEWSSASYSNNDGSTLWSAGWDEVDGVTTGPGGGNIRVNNGKLEMTSTSGDPTPSISRTANLSAFSVDQNVFLNFDYSYQFLNSGSDTLIVEARPDDTSSFTTVRTFTSIGGTNLTPQSESLNLTTLLGSPTWSGTTEIRLRITSGYTGTSRFFFDNIELATGTTDCGIGGISHYEIRIDGNTGPSTVQYPGIRCVGSVITVTGHDNNDFPSASDEAIVLRTSTMKGDWTLISGTGPFDNGALGDGVATYDFQPGETSATFLFNYTDPTANPVVNFNIDSAFPVLPSEDPTLLVADAGLLFYNEVADTPTSITPIGTQISGKASNVAAPSIDLITIEAVRSSDNDPLACSPLFDIGNTVTVGFAAECQDSTTCFPGVQFNLASAVDSASFTPAPDNGGNGTSGSFTDIDVLMADQGNGRVGGELVLTYPDAGQMEIHAEFEIPLGDDLMGQLSGDVLTGSSSPFVVRPFAFAIDFGGDGNTRESVGLADDSYAADSDGSRFVRAGEPFDTTVTAVQYQAGDDLDANGVPDTNAVLWDNDATPNFGKETVDYKVELSSTTTAPAGNLGTLGDTSFTTDFLANGSETHTMTFDEVGIIDLEAELLDLIDTPVNYLNSGQTVVGHVRDVGRFYPDSLGVNAPSEPIISRADARLQSLCLADPMSLPDAERFTYLGEEFGISFDLQAKNLNGDPTRNYVEGFAKLTAVDHLTASEFLAFEEIAGPDVDYSSRLALGTTAPAVVWPDSSAPNVERGIGAVSGNLILNKADIGAGEAPLTDIRIGLNTADADGVPVELSVDIDDDTIDDAAVIGSENFRYGRLLIENTFGPETEDLPVFFRLEYFDGSDFVTNTLDSCTTLFYDASEATAADRSISLVGGTYTDQLDDGETTLELEDVNASNDEVMSFFEGQMLLRSDTDDDGDEVQDDGPFYLSAPGIGNEGGAIVEFDLSDPDLPFSLDFLSFDWRDAAETEDIGSDGIADNPRALIEFGTYRGHDLIINWQEIYVAPD